MKELRDNGIYDVSKHVAYLLTSDAYVYFGTCKVGLTF